VSEVVVKGNWFEQDGDRLLLGGSHTWNNVVSMGGVQAPLGIGNVERLWTYEARAVNTDYGAPWDTDDIKRASPIPWRSSKKGFDLSSVSEAYLTRLKQVVKRAARAGKIAIVNLFEGSLASRSWKYHAFNPSNNIQRIGPAAANLVHTRGPWNSYQFRYAKAVVRALREQDNVIFETGNEFQGRASSIPFARALINKVSGWTDKPIGASHIPSTHWGWMRSTGADWFAPQTPSSIRPDLPGPVIWDDDHHSPGRSVPQQLLDARRVGMIPILMDSYRNSVLSFPSLRAERDAITGLPLSRLNFKKSP
jgi:hypothetical protein